MVGEKPRWSATGAIAAERGGVAGAGARAGAGAGGGAGAGAVTGAGGTPSETRAAAVLVFTLPRSPISFVRASICFMNF